MAFASPGFPAPKFGGLSGSVATSKMASSSSLSSSKIATSFASFGLSSPPSMPAPTSTRGALKFSPSPSTTRMTTAKNNASVTFSSPYSNNPTEPIMTPSSVSSFGATTGRPKRRPTPHPKKQHARAPLVEESTAGLSCTSPNGKVVHSLALPHSKELSEVTEGGRSDTWSIVSHFLPLAGTVSANGDNETQTVSDGERDWDSASKRGKDILAQAPPGTVIVTPLPAEISESLDVDGPLELICVDHDKESKPRRKKAKKSASSFYFLPRLCLYTRRSAYLLQISYSLQQSQQQERPSFSLSSSSSSTFTIKGILSKVTEPFESHLLSSTESRFSTTTTTAAAATTTRTTSSCEILRIRPAPQSHHACGYRVLCPSTAMAMLTTEYAVVLYHGENVDDDDDDDSDTDYYVHGGQNGLVTVPITFGFEDLVGYDNDDEVVVDFCFAAPPPPSISRYDDDDKPTRDLTLFPSMSVWILFKSGAVRSASPILFDGTAMPRSAVLGALRHLDDEIRSLANNDASAETRQLNLGSFASHCRKCRAARQYILDAFGYSQKGQWNNQADNVLVAPHHRSQYATARIGRSSGNATVWPAKLQPFCISSSLWDDDEGEFATGTHATTLEPLAGMGEFCAFVIGRASQRGHAKMEYGAVPSDAIVPRFAFESPDDASALDDMEAGEDGDGVGTIIERVNFRPNDSSPSGYEEENYGYDNYGSEQGRKINALDRHGQFSSVLIVDPMDARMVHHVSADGVITVSSNALEVLVEHVVLSNSERTMPLSSTMTPTKTTAWVCLEASADANAFLTGVIVSNESHFGHIMVARISDGTMEAINLTATKYLHEASTASPTVPLLENSQNKLALVPVNESVKSLDEIPPLHEVLRPTLTKIHEGLSGMGKIVGGATSPRDITPGTLATVLVTKRRCEENVTLPLRELHEVCETRMKHLQVMHRQQKAQLEHMRKTVKELKDRTDDTEEERMKMKSALGVMSQRSATILAAARDLVPTITEAELDYFKQLKRYELTCAKLTSSHDKLREIADTVCDHLDHNNHLRLRLETNENELCQSLLKGQEELLTKNKERVERLDSAVKKLALDSGLDGEGAFLGHSITSGGRGS